ncbi:tripartite-type tricarboxylate transporter receptor subunit TctC [Variovorax boronicumulans]|uniref:tripartite tricarboxylate transporter substrate-binding protein n=1 Tax=Variovorax boronicumulans TaxID=436515 RepID=UPI0027844F28|nr:tripartite tricarboxylate transporter substrate-binding protein [Variovorax boronicumulans]MDP9917276.1 tripartite-type tricarboxylate transporter receptor subunit TctC [Variovorax boronicumulans]
MPQAQKSSVPRRCRSVRQILIFEHRRNGQADSPAFREQGYPQLALNSWFGIVASARTPPEVVARLEAEISEAVRSANGKARLEDAGFGVPQPGPNTAGCCFRIGRADCLNQAH